MMMPLRHAISTNRVTTMNQRCCATSMETSEHKRDNIFTESSSTNRFLVFIGFYMWFYVATATFTTLHIRIIICCFSKRICFSKSFQHFKQIRFENKDVIINMLCARVWAVIICTSFFGFPLNSGHFANPGQDEDA